MNFDKNLYELRNRANLSQEALAEKLGVSRQTIYKWETGQTYPDTDKLSEIAKLFGVSVDSVLEELDDEEAFTKDEIIRKFKSFGKLIGLSVMAIIFAVALFILLSSTLVFPNNGIIGLIVMLSIIFGSVIIIVIGSMNFENFKKEELHIEFSKKEIRRARSSFTTFLVIGISCIFIGIVELICMTMFGDFYVLIGVVVLLTLIGIGVCIIVQAAIPFELYDETESALLPEDKRQPKKSDFVYPVIMLCALCIFLLLGFIWNLWQYSWIAFPIGGILCGIFAIIFGNINNTNQ